MFTISDLVDDVTSLLNK